MKRQLATEWLEKELQNLDVDFESCIVTKSTYFERRASIVEQAKQKELGNLEDAFYEGIGSDKYQQEYGENARGSMLPQQYIKETYGIDK